MTDLNAPAAILFDWDSTLVDNWNGVVEAWNEALGALGLPAKTRRDAIALSGRPPNEIFLEAFGEEHAAQGASLFYKRLRSPDAMDSLTVLPGSEAMLKALHERNMPMAVVSNKKGAILAAEIDHLGWRKYFFTSVGAGDAAYDKPHPAPILYALKQRMISPGTNVWMVGDMHSDMEAAKRAGVTAVLMETTAGLGLGLEGNLETHPPDFRVNDAGAFTELAIGLMRTI